MKLKEYLQTERLSYAYATRIFDISMRELYFYLDGKRIPRRILANNIVDFTQGLVTHEDLMQMHYYTGKKPGPKPKNCW